MTELVSTRRLGDILVDRNLLRPDQLAPVLDRSDGGLLGERLVRERLINEEQLAEALAEQFGLPYADLTNHTVSGELFAKLSAPHAYRYGVVPLRIDNDLLFVAVADPYDLRLADRLERLTGMPVKLEVASAAAIQAALKRSEGASEVLRGVTEDFRPVVVRENEQGEEQLVALDKLGDAGSPVVRLVNSILMAALTRRASDVHIEVHDEGITVKNRIDGVLYPATETLDRRHHSALISRLKIMAELDIAEKRIPQDGRFRLRLGNRDIDFRVSVLPSVFGEDVVIRILDKSAITEGIRDLRLETLGMAPEILKRFRRSIHEPYGMVLITGPTGSGKTTTLYAALSELNTGEDKIITIEDPVEYQLPGIVQIPVNEKKQLTFARGLRSILRHDPDKIMVGEIRDTETAQIAVQSALTGHLVFTTVHANNAFDVIGRFSHMGIDIHNFVSALNCVMAQRLVRRICTQCRKPVKADTELLEASGLDPARYAAEKWYEGAGCDHCNGTGYRGRSAITEFLDLSPRIRQMIIERHPVQELESVAVSEGMVTLRQSALSRAMAGDTTLKEINRVTFID